MTAKHYWQDGRWYSSMFDHAGELVGQVIALPDRFVAFTYTETKNRIGEFVTLEEGKKAVERESEGR